MPAGGSIVAVIAGCSAASAVVVVLLVVVLIKVRSMKHASSGQEAENVEQNDLEYTKCTNSFSDGLSVTHIKEDPFANDFKEDKFIDKI